jgi:septum formation protein
MTEPKPIVLGSASPRRREILASLGVPFVVLVASVDETVLSGETADAYLTRIVRAKLEAVRARIGPDLVAGAAAILVADTSVILDGSILGKPASVEDARAMIERLAGRTHEVHTRFALADSKPTGLLHEETVATEVTFRSLTPDQAARYAASGDGMDKAGGYAVQGLGAAFVSRISGSYSNVVGLPACEVAMALEAHGLR